MYCIRVSIPSVFIFNIILSSRSVRRRLLSMFIIYNQERWKNFNFGFYFASTRWITFHFFSPLVAKMQEPINDMTFFGDI